MSEQRWRDPRAAIDTTPAIMLDEGRETLGDGCVIGQSAAGRYLIAIPGYPGYYSANTFVRALEITNEIQRTYGFRDR